MKISFRNGATAWSLRGGRRGRGPGLKGWCESYIYSISPFSPLLSCSCYNLISSSLLKNHWVCRAAAPQIGYPPELNVVLSLLSFLHLFSFSLENTKKFLLESIISYLVVFVMGRPFLFSFLCADWREGWNCGKWR